jgi:hypothetical protein
MKGHNTMNNREELAVLHAQTDVAIAQTDVAIAQTGAALEELLRHAEQSSAADRHAHYHVLITTHHGPPTIGPDGTPDGTAVVDAHHPLSLDAALMQTRAAIEYAHGCTDVPMAGASIFACYGQCSLPGSWEE